MCERKSFISRVESWNDSCTWSRPGLPSARGRGPPSGRRRRSAGWCSSPGRRASATMSSRSSRTSGSPPDKPQLHGAQFARLAQHPQPVVGAQFVARAARSRPGCSRTRSAAGSGRSARPAARAAVLGAVRRSSARLCQFPDEPALAGRHLDERAHLAAPGPRSSNAAPVPPRCHAGCACRRSA